MANGFPLAIMVEHGFNPFRVMKIAVDRLMAEPSLCVGLLGCFARDHGEGIVVVDAFVVDGFDGE